MKNIDLEELVTALRELPSDYWQEQEKEEEKHQYIFTTQINCSKVHLPLFRDIPGYYTINLVYEVEPEKTEGVFRLEVAQGNESICFDSQDPIGNLYDEVNMKINRIQN
ncbi:MAG: hypothetical protein AABX24_04225 [Nanoarchaeota archaeon]